MLLLPVPTGYRVVVILLGVVGLLVLGAVTSWQRRLPGPGETWSAQPRPRRRLLAAGIPVGASVAALGVLLLVDALTGETQVRGFFAGATVLALMAVTAGGVAIAWLTARSLVRLRR